MVTTNLNSYTNAYMTFTSVLPFLAIAFGFLILIKGAEWLINGSVTLAKRVGVSELLIGLTIVAFGTSLPELVVNIFANSEETAPIAIGNIIGSNIANIFLVLGLAALIRPIYVRRVTVWREVLLAMAAGGILAVMVADSFIGRSGFAGLDMIDGIILISYFAAFLYYSFGHSYLSHEKVEEEINDKENESVSLANALSLIIFGGAGLGFGGQLIVNGAVGIATSLGLESGLIGLTIVAFGTSAPELSTSLIAVKERKTDIAVGNIVGSNLFNTFWVLGISSILRPLPFSGEQFIDVGVAALAGTLLFGMMAFGPGKHVIGKPTGILFLTCYCSYLTYLAIQA